jgi:hypothetical protein
MGFMDKLKGTGGAMGMPTAEDMAMVNRVTRLNQVGVEQPAVVNRMAPTGRTDVGGGQEYQFDVEVRPAGGAAYPASFTQYMHVQSMGSWVSEGAGVKVRVDPQDPASMMLWGGLN